MQPYQQASEEIIRESKKPGEALRTGVKTAAGLIGGGAVLNRIKPFLSNFIAPNIAAKGLEKIDPRFGKFINNAVENGHSVEEAINFVKEKVSEPEKPKENRNIVEQYSPELHKFIANEVTKGRSPIEAGALAQLQDKYKNVIKKITQDHKTDWSAILNTIYGGGQYGGAVNPIQQETQTQQNAPQQQGQQGQQPGPGQQALLSVLQKIQKTRGG